MFSLNNDNIEMKFMDTTFTITNYEEFSFEALDISENEYKKLKNKISLNLLNKNNLDKKENNITRGSYKINLDEKLKGKIINIEKNKKIFRQYNYKQKDGRMKSENITEIMRHITKNNPRRLARVIIYYIFFFSVAFQAS